MGTRGQNLFRNSWRVYSFTPATVLWKGIKAYYSQAPDWHIPDGCYHAYQTGYLEECSKVLLTPLPLVYQNCLTYQLELGGYHNNGRLHLLFRSRSPQLILIILTITDPSLFSLSSASYWRDICIALYLNTSIRL